MSGKYQNCEELTVADVDGLGLTWFRNQEGRVLSSSINWEVDWATDGEYQYFKPVKKVYQIEFERLFNFQMSCRDFDINKVVRYPLEGSLFLK